MIMTSLILMILLNIIVSACVGLTGIAGFLLPMFYTGFLNMPSTEALALSFSAFLASSVPSIFTGQGTWKYAPPWYSPWEA